MTNQSTIDKLIEMRLTAMADAFRIQMDDPAMKEVPFEDRFGMLVDVEYSNRKNNRLKRLIRQAEFEQPDASIAAIDYHSGRKLNKALINRLATCEYITEYRNIFITGATGSGKSTTLASLIGVISKNYKKTIITLEDPIEYLHGHGKGMVLQREIGYDSMSYANAVRAALRQDPDVILVGEMRDLETISIAITAAETGHLVFSTLHTNSAASAVDRMIDVFPPFQQQQIRVQLAGVLEGVVAQQLLPRQEGGRVAAYEVMLAVPAIRNLIPVSYTHLTLPTNSLV